ncbi:transporter [Aquimarina sp. 2-A2]|uniref:transporter n=1 Tax=Aquimarina sp. 2-A2 TaxID=3382644 RepID=UPI00387F2A45
MLHKSYLSIVAVIFFLFLNNSALSQTSVHGFQLKKGELTVATSYTYKHFDKFYRGETLTNGNPAGLGEITSSIYSLYASYGILDWLSTTITLPYISVESEAGALDPVTNDDTESSLQDLAVYIKARALANTFTNKATLNISGALGVSVPVGGYNGGGVLSVGNEATAIDGIAIAQYTLPSNLFIETLFGYSYRTSSDFDIPNAYYYSFKLGYFCSWFYADTKVSVQNSTSGLQIGSPEFGAAGGPAALPETEVDYTNISFTLYVPIYKQALGVSGSYGVNATGRNFNKESFYSIGLVYNLR